MFSPVEKGAKREGGGGVAGRQRVAPRFASDICHRKGLSEAVVQRGGERTDTLQNGGHLPERKDRITVDPEIFGGKPIVRGHRLAVEHVIAMLDAGDHVEAILAGYPWMEPEDVLACVEYARGLGAGPLMCKPPLHKGRAEPDAAR